MQQGSSAPLGRFCGTGRRKCDTAAVIDMPGRMPITGRRSVRMLEP